MNRFKAVCASQLGPSLGTQLWGATEDGHVFSTVQTSANAPWEEWSESEWLNAPAKIIALTAAPDQNGRQSLWALTADHVLHCKSQGPGEKWSDPTARWFNAPKLTCICAAIAFSGWNRWGRYLWGVGEDGQLYWTYEDLQKGLNPWVNWSVFDAPQTIDAPQKIIALAAAPALNGYMSLWALTEDHALHCKPQSVSKLAQDWDPWSDKEVSWHNSPKLTGICATLLGGSRGRAVWGIGEDKQLYWTYETREGWASSGWDPFDSTGEPKDISSLCAAQQNQGRVMLWALSQDNSLYNNTTTASGDWTGWDVGGTRLLTYGIIDDIVRILSGSLYDQGVTYLRTSGNKFTLLDTPRLWGADSTAPNGGSPASKNFCLEITDVIGSAERQLDIALLFNTDIQISPGWIFRGFPDGKFQDAIAKGLLKLSQKKGSKPDIRILLGAPQTVSLINDLVRLLSLPLPSTSTIINGLLKSLPKQMQAWLQKTIEIYQPLKEMKCPIHLGVNAPGTWNHAKIIAADGNLVITGGHNLWFDDYMGPAPVHDVSGRFEGPAAQGAHQFCEKLWETATNKIHLIDGNFTTSKPNTPSPKMIPASPVGGVEMLSLGRLGSGVAHTFSFSTNAGVTGRIVALCRAKRTLRISQQSLMGFKLPGLLPYDFYTCLAIVRAVRAGVDVQIVLSNELQNYGGSAKQVLRHLQKMYLADLDQTTDQFKKAPARENIDAWVSLAAGQESLGGEIKNVNFRDPRCNEFNKKLKLATLYYSDNQMRWKIGSGWKAAGNHSKVYICDDDAFYVGSDNFYVSLHRAGLQEFGYLVEDQGETGKFISDYWNNLWKYSGPRALN